MISLPQVKTCPCCETVNVILVNGIIHKHDFKGLENHALRKKFICRKCKEEIGLFQRISNHNQHKDMLIWLNDFKCKESYYAKLKQLNQRKSKLRKNLHIQKPKIKSKENGENKYNETLLEINDIQDKIRSDRIKLRIRMKIQKKATTINELT